MSDARRLTALVGALLFARAASAVVVFQPGYTDAYYYANVAKRLAAGQGLTADFIWNFMEATGPLPVASHRFWMPLPTVLGSVGMKVLPFLEAFRAAQAAEIVVACLIPIVTYCIARRSGTSAATGLVAAAVAGLGGAFAPGWVSLDAFAPAAVLGTVFFLCVRRAALGEARFGALAGLVVGLLFLARAEGALFGLALVALLWSHATRRAGIAGCAVALAIGLGWLARDIALGGSPDLIGRSVLLVRYEDFFAAPTGSGALAKAVGWSSFVAAMPQVLAAKIAALGTNAITFVFAFGLLLVPGIVRALWTRRHHADARAFAGLLLLVYLAESVVFTLHSTRGSYFHSLAAFFPFGVVLGVLGTADLLRTVERGRLAAAAGIVAAAAISVFAVGQWDASFNGPYRDRLAIVGRIPPGPFMAIDAAAWRWIADRPVVVTPASGPDPCTLGGPYAITSIVLEPAHFSGYDTLLADGSRPDFIGDPIAAGRARIYPVRSDVARTECLTAR